MTAAQIIREARLKAGLTQAELAERLGRERAQVARWEIGGQEPSFANLNSAVEACGFVLQIAIGERASTPELDAELKRSVPQAPQQRIQALLDEFGAATVSKPPPFDPYALFAALDRERIGYVVIGGFARVVHGSAEITDGLDVVPSLHPENVRRLGRALAELGVDEPDLGERLAAREPVTVQTPAGELRLVPEPWGTRGYDDLRIRANRDNLGRGARPAVASVVDCVRMLDASEREPDAERLVRLRRVMELERQLVPSRGLYIER